MSEKKGTFDTDELVVFLEMNLYVPKSDAARAIIARLRAGDEVVTEAIKVIGDLGLWDDPQFNELSKLIDKYEGKE